MYELSQKYVCGILHMITFSVSSDATVSGLRGQCLPCTQRRGHPLAPSAGECSSLLPKLNYTLQMSLNGSSIAALGLRVMLMYYLPATSEETLLNVDIRNNALFRARTYCRNFRFGLSRQNT
jgi:hypothetical protein